MDEDDVYQRFVVCPPTGGMVQEINWSDNPWFPAELRAEKDHLQTRDAA
jgi:phage terminase large subunit